jgi:hypothetical protein
MEQAVFRKSYLVKNQARILQIVSLVNHSLYLERSQRQGCN